MQARSPQVLGKDVFLRWALVLCKMQTELEKATDLLWSPWQPLQKGAPEHPPSHRTRRRSASLAMGYGDPESLG